jgi:hypothetical protein
VPLGARAREHQRPYHRRLLLCSRDEHVVAAELAPP